MIISQTPFRVSFFGGGTDYPVWFREHGGAVLATTIDKYCYIACRYLPPFFEHKSRIVYSKVELVSSNDQIEHPAVRAVLRHLKIDDGVEIHYDGDLPARSGLGSSSAFTVSLLQALYALQQRMPTKPELANTAIHIEQEVLREHVGCQDQILAAFGGLVRIDFPGHADPYVFHVTPVILARERLNTLQDHFLLYFTGISRMASGIAKEQLARVKDHTRALSRMRDMVDEAIVILTSQRPLAEFGVLLHEGWLLKRSLSPLVSSATIDAIYETARGAGAIGGKLLGAGGGGFLLLMANPEDHARIHERLNGLLRVPFRFEQGGSRIIVYDPAATVQERILMQTNAEPRELAVVAQMRTSHDPAVSSGRC
jgi:D-glycero-alpha-D-manno-heptose-7-phosphate kinase